MQQRQYSDNELFGIIQEVYFGATSWEQGRQAALRGRTLSDNPETPDTISYDEWKKGFVHGAVYDVPQSEQIEEIVMVCGFHAIRPPSPLSSGQAFQGHLATCSTAIRPGSRSAATQGWHC
uniref:Uncharacterized protein n=1 Tax=Pseudomonas aeruginosa TaxID=287 RepID=A0A7S5YCL5_PSEAI|nr:hypothetical protein [Pseudomonas aeruginosa]QLG05585.1 hypothetical protein [Pseudomonas aeruginosa]